MKKELFLGESLLKCYQKGRMMTMILSQNNKALPWIYYNNMQICCHNINEKGEPFVMDICNSVAPFLIKEWDNCPYIRDNSFSINEIKEQYSSVAEFIVKRINNDEYVYCCLNTKYIAAYDKDIYKDTNIHDIFIYGYDNKTFICCDYFGNDYERKRIPFTEIEKGIMHINESKIVDDYVNGIHCFRLQKTSKFSFFSADDINRNHILSKMYEIIYPRYSEVTNIIFNRDNGKSIHSIGIDVYEKYVEFLLNSEDQLDYRPFFVIKDHLKMIFCAVEFFEIPFIEESKALYNDAEKLATYSLKQFIDPKTKTIELLVNRIEELKKKEESLLLSILDYYNYSKRR